MAADEEEEKENGFLESPGVDFGSVFDVPKLASTAYQQFNAFKKLLCNNLLPSSFR